jgi:hypothetical protein
VRGQLARLPLRTRLVAGFVVAMLVLLVAAGAFVYWRVEYALDRGLDDELAQASATIEPLIGPTGRVTNAEAADATGAVWQVLGADGAVLEEVLDYAANPYREIALPPGFPPLAEEPQVAFWRRYAAEAGEIGTAAALSRRSCERSPRGLPTR